MDTKKIKAVTPPEEGTKKPGFVKFEDGSSAKYWPNVKFGARLEVGVSAECVIEQKEGNRGPEFFLKQWGDPVKKGAAYGGFPGRQITPEERRSIAAQACIKAACELFHGTGNMSEAAKAAAGFMKLHDKIVAEGKEVANV